MPRYDYQCRACGDTFEVTKPIALASEAAPCPHGHDDTVKLLSTVALAGRAGSASMPAPRAPRAAGGGGGGGCCGGACGC